jgi:RHH-type rel operon transcriptional repressor/antitoxin RelB
MRAYLSGSLANGDVLKYTEYTDYMHSKGYIMATSIRLDSTIEQRLDKLAAQTGRTKAYYLRELVAKGLDDLEDYYLAAATMERVRKGEERIFTLEEAERDLGLADKGL